MRIEHKILSLGIAIMLLGCGGENKTQEKSIAQKTKEILGETNESGCDGDKVTENETCSDKESSSNFILNTLLKEGSNQTQPEESSLRNQLNILLDDMKDEEKEKQKKSNNKKDLESLVSQVGELMGKDSANVVEGLENLVASYDKEKNGESIRDELSSLVESAENSKLKREDIENRLLSLVDEVENKKLKKEEVEEKLLLLVESASENKKESFKQTQLSLESLVSDAEQEGTKEAKQLAQSIIEDVSTNQIKILRTEDEFVVIQVQQGDSLSSLASKYYGDATKYRIIYEANKDKVGSKNRIYSGTRLVIPKL